METDAYIKKFKKSFISDTIPNFDFHETYFEQVGEHDYILSDDIDKDEYLNLIAFQWLDDYEASDIYYYKAVAKLFELQ